MKDKEIHCTSCKKKVENLSEVAIFKCPECLKVDVIRCKSCRIRAIKYICLNCGFEGPN